MQAAANAEARPKTQGQRRYASVSAPLADAGYLRVEQVLSLLPIARSAWYAGVRTGRYPPPVRLGPRTVAWKVSDIKQVLERVAQPDEQARQAAAMPVMPEPPKKLARIARARLAASGSRS